MENAMKRKILIAAGIGFSILFFRCAGARPQTGKSEYITEPVFQGKCYVYEDGRTHPHTVILLHGIGESASRDWEHVIPKLANKYHVLTFDLPGFGRSEKQNALYSPANYAAFVKWIADERVPGPFTLVGHSMGGVIALQFAAVYPKNLQNLVLIDVPGILYRSAAFRSAGQLIANAWAGDWQERIMGITDSIWGTILSAMESRVLAPDADILLASADLRKRMLKGRPDLIAGMALAQEDFSRRLEFIKQPVTLFWGTEDQIAPIRTAKVLVALLPNAELIALEGYGHSPMIENPDRFDTLLMQSIQSKSPAKKIPKTAAPSEKVVRFSEESGRTLSGAYKRLEIEYCDDFKLVDLTAESVQIKESTVNIENCRISGGRNALAAYNSYITMTGGSLDADVAIIAEGSELDLAGVQIRGKDAIIKTEDWATLTLSISRAYMEDEVWYLHGIEELTADILPWPKSTH
jgi:pimeloyl-ACP methyl ester carboxylesterase